MSNNLSIKNEDDMEVPAFSGGVQPIFSSSSAFTKYQPLTNLQRGNVVQEKSSLTHSRTSFELAAQGEIFNDTLIDVSQKDSQGLSLVHVAAMHGQMLTIRCLVRRGANLNARDQQGHTVLHYAAFHGHHHVVRDLLQMSPKLVDQVDDEGNSALMFACYQKRTAVVHELLKHGADLSLYNRKEQSCYSITQSVKAGEVQSLLERRIIELLEIKLLSD